MLTPNLVFIKKRMKELELNKSSLARAAGLHRNTLINLFRGSHNCTLSTVSKVAEVLLVGPLSLLKEEFPNGSNL